MTVPTTAAADPPGIDPPGIDHAPVEAWLAAHINGLVPPVTFTLISGGHSNITYFADDAAGRTYVMRRPPLGAKPGNAHNMAREFVVIGALGETEVPVPRALALCDDETVNGSPFYLMSHVEGEVVENPSRADRCLATAASRRRASEQIVDVLAALHAVDIDAVGLGTLARRDGFLDRQLKRIGALWQQNKTRELPLMDALHDRLVATQPEQHYTGIVHSDYRMGNVMFAADGTLTGVLDWELWTLGDPPADLGFLLNSWGEPHEKTPEVLMQVPPTKAPGFASRAEVTARYAEQTGFDVSNIEYYQAFQHWKIAVIAEGVKRRYESAQMASTDVDFAHLSQRVIDMAGMARDLLDRIS